MRNFTPSWSVLRQVTGKDRLALGKAVQSSQQANLTPRTVQADQVVKSVCPYCDVGCGQRVFVKDGEVVQMERTADKRGFRFDLTLPGLIPCRAFLRGRQSASQKRGTHATPSTTRDRCRGRRHGGAQRHHVRRHDRPGQGG